LKTTIRTFVFDSNYSLIKLCPHIRLEGQKVDHRVHFEYLETVKIFCVQCTKWHKIEIVPKSMDKYSVNMELTVGNARVSLQKLDRSSYLQILFQSVALWGRFRVAER